jgi:hypothetical protein
MTHIMNVHQFIDEIVTTIYAELLNTNICATQDSLVLH